MESNQKHNTEPILIPVSDLIQNTGVSTDTVRGLGWKTTELIPIESALEFLEARKRPFGRWSKDNAERASSYLQHLKTSLGALHSQTNTTGPGLAPGEMESSTYERDLFNPGPYSAATDSVSTPTESPANRSNPKRDWFLFAVLTIGIIAQMVHTGGFFYQNSPIVHPESIRIVLCLLFAIAVDLTALVQTIRKGQQAYLYAFALIHLAMNLLFHQSTHGITLGNILLSFVLAFTNYSYAALFADKKK